MKYRYITYPIIAAILLTPNYSKKDYQPFEQDTQLKQAITVQQPDTTIDLEGNIFAILKSLNSSVIRKIPGTNNRLQLKAYEIPNDNIRLELWIDGYPKKIIKNGAELEDITYDKKIGFKSMKAGIKDDTTFVCCWLNDMDVILLKYIKDKDKFKLEPDFVP